MNELKNGIIKIGDISIAKDATIEDFKNLSSDIVEISYSEFGDSLVRVKSPIISNEIEMFVKLFFSELSKYPDVELIGPPITDLNISEEEAAKLRLEQSKKWLKGAIDVEPTTEDSFGISYEFDWGYIIASIYEDRDYGLSGGNIKIEYMDK